MIEYPFSCFGYEVAGMLCSATWPRAWPKCECPLQYNMAWAWPKCKCPSLLDSLVSCLGFLVSSEIQVGFRLRRGYLSWPSSQTNSQLVSRSMGCYSQPDRTNCQPVLRSMHNYFQPDSMAISQGPTFEIQTADDHFLTLYIISKENFLTTRTKWRSGFWRLEFQIWATSIKLNKA